VGFTLRRLVAKTAARRAHSSSSSILLPPQAGVGVKGGCEGLIHATRRYVETMGSDRAFVKLDFSNAFNSLRRDALLDAVSRHHPDLLDFALSSYGAASELWVGETVLSSAEGV
jgi:hypothetical protein